MNKFSFLLVFALASFSMSARSQGPCRLALDSLLQFVETAELTSNSAKRLDRLTAVLYRCQIQDAANQWQSGLIAPTLAFERINEASTEYSRVAPFAQPASNPQITHLRAAFVDAVEPNPDCVEWPESVSTPLEVTLRQAMVPANSSNAAPSQVVDTADINWLYWMALVVLLLLLIVSFVWQTRKYAHLRRVLDRRSASSNHDHSKAASNGFTKAQSDLLRGLALAFPGPVSAESIKQQVDNWVEIHIARHPPVAPENLAASVPIDVPSMPANKVLFAQPPNEEGGYFSNLRSDFDPNASYYRLEFGQGAREASFTVVKDASSQERAIRTLEHYLIACTIQGDIDKTRTRVHTIKPGRAVLDGDRWKVDEPTTIELQ